MLVVMGEGNAVQLRQLLLRVENAGSKWLLLLLLA
jgi:hypothetical protein